MKQNTTKIETQTTSSSTTSFLSLPIIQFSIYVITLIVAVSLSWANLSGRVDLLSQKMDLILTNQNTMIASMQQTDVDLSIKYSDMQRQWGELSQRVTRLER